VPQVEKVEVASSTPEATAPATPAVSDVKMEEPAGKGKKRKRERKITANNKVCQLSNKMRKQLLKFWTSLDPKPELDTFIFVSRQHAFTGKPLSYRQSERRFLEICRAAEIEGEDTLGTHCFRKTFARRMLKAIKNKNKHLGDSSSADMLDLQEAMQQKSLQSTQHYIRADSQGVKALLMDDDGDDF